MPFVPFLPQNSSMPKENPRQPSEDKLCAVTQQQPHTDIPAKWKLSISNWYFSSCTNLGTEH